MTTTWFTVLLEPLALITWGLLILLVLCYRKKDWEMLSTVSVVLIILFIFASPFTANLILEQLEMTHKDQSSCVTDKKNIVIVILAGGMNRSNSESAQIEALHIASIRRALATARLANKTLKPYLIVTGGSGGTVKEADLISRLLIHLGVDQNRIIKELTAKNTYENAIQTKSVLEHLGLNRILLVTSAIHMPRAVATFRKQNIDVCTYPIDFRGVDPIFPGAFIPQISALQKSTDSFHEIAGLLWYRINDWL